MESINDSLKNVSKVLEILKKFEPANRDLFINYGFSIIEAQLLLEKTIDILSKET